MNLKFKLIYEIVFSISFKLLYTNRINSDDFNTKNLLASLMQPQFEFSSGIISLRKFLSKLLVLKCVDEGSRKMYSRFVSILNQENKEREWVESNDANNGKWISNQLIIVHLNCECPLTVFVCGKKQFGGTTIYYKFIFRFFCVSVNFI